MKIITTLLVVTLCSVPFDASATWKSGQATPPEPDRGVRMKRKLDDLKREPSVRQVQEAALQYFRVNSSQVESMRSRARMKALAPVFEVAGGYTQSDLGDRSTNAEAGFVDLQNDPWVTRGSEGRGWNARAKMTLNLPQLIFNSEELDVASLAGLVEGLLKESTRLFFMRRRLQVDMILLPPTDTATKLSKELRIEELTGLLDAMTGGWFQQQLDALHHAKTGPAPVRPAHLRAAATSATPVLQVPPSSPSARQPGEILKP